jgi:hypothetical protein
MDRAALLSAWAEIVAAGRDQTSACDTTATPMGGLYDPEVEKRRISLEMELRLRELA